MIFLRSYLALKGRSSLVEDGPLDYGADRPHFLGTRAVRLGALRLGADPSAVLRGKLVRPYTNKNAPILFVIGAFDTDSIRYCCVKFW